MLYLKHNLPRLDFEMYLAVWNAVRARGITQRRFDHEVEKVLVTAETQGAHDAVKEGVQIMEQMVLVDRMLAIIGDQAL